MIHDDESARAALARALIELAFGPAIVVGARERSNMILVGAAVSELHLLVPPWEFRTVAEEVGDQVGAPVIRYAIDDGNRPRQRVDAANLILFELPRVDDPMALVDALLAQVADGGLVLVDATMTVSMWRRLERMLGSVLDEMTGFDVEGESSPVETERRGAHVHVRLVGRRRAPGRDLEIVVPEPAQITALLYARGDHDQVRALAFSLLMRQNYPPHLVLVLDDAADGEESVPDDLWGMAADAASQPALLRTGGVGRSAAMAQASEHIETPAFSFVDPRDVETLAPNWAGILAAALASAPDLDAVVCGVLPAAGAAAHAFCGGEAIRESSEVLFDVMTHGSTPLAAWAFASTMLGDGELAGADADLGFAFAVQLEIAETAGVASLPVPLLVARSGADADLDDAPSVVRALLAHQKSSDLGRLAAHFADDSSKRGRALVVRGDALARAGALEAAAADYQLAATKHPELTEALLRLAAMALAANDPERAAALLDGIDATPDAAITAECERARAAVLGARGLVADASDRLEFLAAEYPDHDAIAHDRLAAAIMLGSRERIGAAVAALSGEATTPSGFPTFAAVSANAAFERESEAAG